MKSISTALIVCFLFQELSYANPDLKSIQLSFSPKFLTEFKIPRSVAVVEDIYQESSKPFTEIVNTSSPNILAGDRTDSRQKHAGMTVILIQDAHINESAQKNIAKVLDIIFKSQTRHPETWRSLPAGRQGSPHDEIPYVFLEAGTGNDSLSFLRQYATQTKREEVAKSYLKKGYIQGPDYLDLTSDRNFILWGVEDKTLYFKGLEDYRFLKDKREHLNAYLDKVTRAAKTLKSKIYNPSLQSFDGKREAFLKGDLSLTDYFDVLVAEAKKLNMSVDESFPYLAELQRIKEKEAGINFSKASEEEMRAFSSLSEEDQKELVEESKKQNSPFAIDAQEHKEAKAFYAMLEEKLTQAAFSGDRLAVSANQSFAQTPNRQPLTVLYPELTKYFAYLKETEKLNPEKILAEKENLEAFIYASLTRSKDEKRLTQVSKSQEVLKRLFNLSLTSQDFEELERDHKNFDIVQISGFLNKKIMDLASHYEDALFLDPGYEEAFQKAREFYDLTRERDRVFVKNILQKMDEEKLDKAILVAGGYHTEHLKVLLKEKSISYVSIIPQVLQETNMKKYESILLNQVDSRQEMEHQSTKAPGHHAVILSDPERAKRVEGESKDLITNKEIPNKWGVLSGAEATAMVNGSRLSVVDLLKEGLGAPVTASVIASHREAKAKQSDLSDRHTTAKAPTFAMTDKFSGARLAADKKWYQQEARERLDPKLVTGNLQRIRNILGSILNQIENPDQWLEEEHLEPDVIHRYGRAIRRFDQVVLHRKHMTAAKLEKEYRLLHALLGEKGYIRKAGDYSSEKEGEEVKQLFEYLFSEEVDRKIKQDESGAIEVAAYVYATLVNLQPFYDGNKRTASLIMNYILLKFGYTPFILDEDNVVRYAQIVYPVNEANKISERAFREFLESQVKKSGSRLAKNEGEPSLSTNGARLAGLYIMAIDLEKEFDKKKAREFLKELVSTPLTLAKVRRSTSFKFSMNEIRKNSDNRAYVMTVVRSVKKLMESKSSAVQSQTRAEKIELPFGLVMEKTQQGIVSGVDSIVGWIIDQGYEPSLFLRLYRQALRHAEYVYSTEGPAMAKKEDIHPQTGLPSLLLSQNLYNQLKEFAGNVHDFVPYIMAIPREAKGLMMAMAAKEELRSVTEFSQKTLEDAFDLFDRMIQATQQRNLGSTLTEVFMLFFNTLNQIPVVVNLLTTYSQEIVESSVKVLAGEHLEDLEHQRALKWAADKKLFSVDQATYEGSLNRYFHPDENDIFAQNLYYIWRMYLRIWASDASLFYSYSSGVTLMALLLLEVHKFLDSNGQIGTNPNLVARMFAGEQPARQEFANSASTLFEPTRQLAQELDSRVTVVSSEMLKKLENLTGARLAKNEGKPSLSANGARLAGFGQRAEVREETTDNLSSDKEGSRMASLAAAQTPTFFSRVVNLFSWLGVAIRTASLRVLSSISTVVNLSSTLSSRSVLAVTASVTVLKSLFRSSTSAATSLGVNDSGSLDMRKTISNQFNLVKPETTTEGATGARLALREKIQEAQTHLRNAMTVLDPEWEKPKKISLLDIAADYRDQNVPKPYLNETSLLAEFYGAIKILKEAMLLSDSKNPIVDAQAVLYRLGRIEVMLAPLVWVLKDQASEFPNTVIPFKLEESKKESLRQILLQAHLLVKTIGFELRNEYLEPGGLGTDHGARLADQRDNVQEHILAASNTFKVAEKLISPETISKLGELAPKLADIKEKIATATQLAEQLKTDFDNSNLKQQVSSALTELIKDSKVAQNRVYSLEKIAQRMVGGQFLDTDVEYNLFGALMNSVINEFEQASEKLSGARLATETSSRTPARVSEQEAPDVILAGARLAVPVFEDERTWIRRIIKEYADLLGLKDTLEKEKYAAPIKTDENLTRHSAERMSAELNRANYSLAARAMRVGYQNLQKRSWFGPFFRFTAKGRRILSLINEVGKRGSAQKGGPSVQAANPPDSPFPPIDETKLTERGDQGARLATDEEVSRNAQEILNKSEYAYLRQIYLEYKRKEVAGIDNWAYRLGISPQIRGHIQEVAGELIAAKHIEEHIKGAKLIGLGLSLGKGEVLGNLEVDNVFRIGDQVLIAEVKQDDITPHFRGKVKGILSHQVQRQARVVDALVSSRLQVAIRYGVVGIGTKIISLEDQEKDLGVFKRVGDIAMYRPGQISIRSAERTYPVYFMPLKERIIDMPSKGKVPLAEPPQVNSQGESFIEVLHGYFALSPLSDEQLQKPPQLMDTGVAWDENFKKAIKWEQLFPRITRTVNRWISNVEKSQVIEGKITKQDKDLVFTALSFFYREGLKKGYSFNSLKREFANVYERENGMKKAWETLKKHGQQLQLGARLAIPASRLVSLTNIEGIKDYFRDLFDWHSPPGYSYKVKGGTDGYYWVKNTYKVLDPDNAVLARLIHAGQARYKDNEEHTAFIVDKGIGEESINALKAYVKAYDINQVNEEADIDGAVEKYIKVIQGGEQVKDEEHGFEHVKDILGWLAGIINRKNTVVIIGGGALLDMAALAAALYSRGVKTVLRIPTTSQSQDDSGVAVKYGINFAGKKNKVGGFGAAYGVIIDNNFLKTQDERSYRAGLIEIVKVALMKDKKFFHYLNRYYQDVLDKKFDTWETGEGVISRMRLFLKKIVRRPVYRNKAETIVNHAAWLHARQISTDWNESKSGRPLDYGHWLAHRLEKLSNHRLFHGEAVSIGVAVDSFISYRRGLLSEEELKMILDLQVNKLKLPIDDELLDESYRDQIMKGLTEFQSHLGSKAIPLLNGIGRTVDVLDMNERDSLEEVDYAIQAIRHFKNTGTILGARLTSHRESEAVLSYKNKAGALNTIDRLKIKAARTVAADTGFENIEEKIKAFKKAQRYLSKAGMLAHKYHEGVADISLLQAVNFLQQARGYRSQNEIKQTLHFYEAALQRAKRSLGIDRDEKTLLLLHEIETERNDLKSGARLSTNDFFAEIRALDQDYGPHSIDGYFSNEEGIDRLLEQLDKLPGKGSGIHIGFSGWLNLAIMAKRRSQYGILLDISGALPESFSKIEKVMRSLDIHASLSDRRRQFLDLMHTEFEGTPKDQLEKWMPWFNHDEEFDYIQNMFREGKIVYLRVDARTYEKFEVISKWMQKNNLKLDSLYASNVYETFSNPDVGVFVRDGNEVIHQQSFVKSMSFIAGPKTNFIEAGPRWISAAYPSLSVKFFNADELRARIGKFAGARLARQTAGRVSGVKNTPPTEKSVVEAKRRPDGILSGAQLVEPNIKIIKAEVGEILENSEALTAFLIRTYQNQRNQFPGSLALDIREDNGTIPVFKVDAQPTKESIRLALFYKGKEVFAVENLSQAIAELNKKKSPKERQALADLGFQSLERVSLRRLDSVLAPKNYSRSAGFVEIDLAKIARQFQGIPKEKEELESDLSLLFKKVALQSGNFYFSNSAILESLDASLKAQFLRLQLNRNNKGRVDTRRPENRIVAELYFDDSRPEPEIHVDSQKIVVYSSGFKNNQVPDFTVDLRIAQEAVDFYTTNAINGSIPVKDSKEEAELIEKLAQSDLYTAIKEFSLSRTSALIKAKEMHGIFTGHIKSYDLIRLIFIRPLLQFLDDRLKATRLMLQTQIAA